MNDWNDAWLTVLNLALKNGKDNLHNYSSALYLNSSLYYELPNAEQIIVGIYSASEVDVLTKWGIDEAYAHYTHTHTLPIKC